MVNSFLVFKFTIEIPDTINNSASKILEVIGSPKTIPPSKTPAIGIMNMNECNETAPYRFSMVFQATKPKEDAIRPWYNTAPNMLGLNCEIIKSSNKMASIKQSGTASNVGKSTT